MKCSNCPFSLPCYTDKLRKGSNYHGANCLDVFMCLTCGFVVMKNGVTELRISLGAEAGEGAGEEAGEGEGADSEYLCVHERQRFVFECAQRTKEKVRKELCKDAWKVEQLETNGNVLIKDTAFGGRGEELLVIHKCELCKKAIFVKRVHIFYLETGKEETIERWF